MTKKVKRDQYVYLNAKAFNIDVLKEMRKVEELEGVFVNYNCKGIQQCNFLFIVKENGIPQSLYKRHENGKFELLFSGKGELIDRFLDNTPANYKPVESVLKVGNDLSMHYNYCARNQEYFLLAKVENTNPVRKLRFK
jgi:hypothetical protein